MFSQGPRNHTISIASCLQMSVAAGPIQTKLGVLGRSRPCIRRGFPVQIECGVKNKLGLSGITRYWNSS